MVSRYVTNGPVKQEGMCLLPPPPPHYRMMPPQRTDGGFHVTGPPQTFVAQQPPNQAGNQGPGLRGMAPPGPPTQASTPPNADLKVPHVQQQASLNLYVQQRPGQSFFQRPPPPPNQTQRMVNPRQAQQQIYPQQPSQMIMSPAPALYFNVPYFNGAQRPAATFMPPNYQIISGTPQMYQPYPQQSQQYYFNQMNMQRQAQSQSQVQSVTPNIPHQPPPNVSMTQLPPPNPIPKAKSKRRNNAIPIINPDTGKEINNEDDDIPHPSSGESSARQTPQPHNPVKEVQAAFAKQVAQSLSGEVHEDQEQAPSLEQHHIEPIPAHSTFHPHPSGVHNTNRNELVQGSKLQVPMKEFVPANQSSTAKETPVVSAISNSAEITITNKQVKDRESPAKSRKPREAPPKEAREPPKEVPKEPFPQMERPAAAIIVKEDKPKEPVVPPQNPSPQPSPKEVKEKEVPKEEKKNPKKEKNESNKSAAAAANLVTQEVVPDIVSAPPPAQDAKSKQSSQRGKDAPKQGATTGSNKNQTAAPVVVPQSQPAKANNKSNKMKELNLKGATKEGTDMDAISDNMDALNANLTNSNAVINDNSVFSQPANIIIDNKKIDSNEVPTIKPEVKTLPKNKIDVCDIVREVPKPFVAPAAPVETKDETDRAALNNDKLVQSKNEANAKAINNDEAAGGEGGTGGSKPAYPYKEDQWSPLNQDGKKVYGKDFLLALRNDPKSKERPENILMDVIAQNDNSRVGDVSRYAMSGRTDFTPSFSNNFPGKSQSQRGAPTKRGSQQGKINNNAKGGKSGSVIRVSISFKEDVKLHETENAWKPARMVLGPSTTDEDKKTAELYRRVRGVLNKLTPQKFTTLITQIKTLPIDTPERLQGVIDLVFEKAVDEPNFSVAYALMCRELALMQVPSSADNKKDFVNFRKLLVTRCQLEFEKNSNEETNRNERLKEIEDCPDPEKKKEILISLEEEDRRIRMKSVGNIRFIGELFKQQMLTVNIMMRCLQNLIDNKDEERLECLCKLLTTIGKELETKKMNLGPIFSTMKEIGDKKNGKVSSRVRFMLQDVIDLRNCNWVPRRQDLNPKTIDQIQKEADNEQMTIQAMNSVPTPRKDDRGGGASSSNADRKRGGGNRNVSDDGWSTAPSRNKNVQFSVQSDKLKLCKVPTADEPLGCSQMFGTWGRGSNIKTQQHAPATGPTANSNMYAALEKVQDVVENRSINARPNNKDPYSSKGHSLERSYNKQYDGRGSRSGSQHRSNESSQRSTPTPVHPQMKVQSIAVPEPVPLSPDHLERRIKNIIDEYINDCCTIQETNGDIKSCLPASALEQFVEEAYNSILDRSKTARLKTGKLFAQLIEMDTLPLETYCQALVKVFSFAEDFIVDIPNIWDCYAELISAPVNDSVLPLNRLHTSCAFIISLGYAHKLLGSLFKLVIEEKGPNFLEGIWKNSKLDFTDFMSQDIVERFLVDNHLDFLVHSSESPFGQSNLSYPQIQEKLAQFIQSKLSLKSKDFDDIQKWICANVGDRMKEKQFIRVLATVVIESSIINHKLDVDKLRDLYAFLVRYVDGNADFELQCLYAIQTIVNRLDHPQGLLLKIFNTLYEDTIFSHDSFVTWEQSDDPAEQEKKGVAVKQLTSFFTQLRENDEESASSGSEEA